MSKKPTFTDLLSEVTELVFSPMKIIDENGDIQYIKVTVKGNVVPVMQPDGTWQFPDATEMLFEKYEGPLVPPERTTDDQS